MAEEKKNLIDWFKEHPKVTFVSRAIAWFCFAAIFPFVFIAWRYDIFKGSRLQLSGLGLIAIIIASIAVLSLVKYVYRGLEEGLIKRCVGGFISIIIPLIILYVLISSIENSVDAFKVSLGCTILCEAIAIPFNLFQDWLKGKEDSKKESFIEMAVDKFFKRKEESDKK